MLFEAWVSNYDFLQCMAKHGFFFNAVFAAENTEHLGWHLLKVNQNVIKMAMLPEMIHGICIKM